MSHPAQHYCPNCKSITTCKLADYHSAKDFTGDYGQRWSSTRYPDIKWNRRVRECLVCEQLYTTAEINQDVLWELVRLRIRVEELQETIEVHKAAAKSASDALDQAAKSASDALDQLSSAMDAIAGVESKKADV